MTHFKKSKFSHFFKKKNFKYLVCFSASIRRSCQGHDRFVGSDCEDEKCGPRFGQLELQKNEEDPDE